MQPESHVAGQGGDGGSAAPPATVLRLRLFVATGGFLGERAIAGLRALCEERVPGRYDIEVVDVLKHPKVAEASRILATPTLVRLAPLPEVRLVGDFRSKDDVADALGLPHRPLDALDTNDPRPDASTTDPRPEADTNDRPAHPNATRPERRQEEHPS